MSGRPNFGPAFWNDIPTTTRVTSTITTTKTLQLASIPTATSTSSSSESAVSTSTISETTSAATTTTTTTTSSSTETQPTATPTAESTGNEDGTFGYYSYNPSMALAILFTLLFFFHMCYHFYLSIYIPHMVKSVNRKHSYTIALFVASFCFTLGFTLRAVSSQHGHESNSALYTASLLFIIFGPVFVCASMYLLLTHLIDFCLPFGPMQQFLGLNPGHLSKILILSDVFGFLFQCIGGAVMSGSPGFTNDTGTNVLLFGLTIQLASFTFFLGLLFLFGRRVHGGGENGENDEKEPMSPNGSAVPANWHHKKAFGMNPLVAEVVRSMWIAGLLMEIRSIYRLVEFATGSDGYFSQHEWTFWIFEAVTMWFVLLALEWYHPVKLLQSRGRAWFVDKHNGLQR